MKTLIAAAFLVLAFSTTAQAQVSVIPTPATRFMWEQSASSLEVAQAYRYTLYANGDITGSVLAATCTGTATPFTCSAPLPPSVSTIGAYSVVLAAQASLGGTPVVWSPEARSTPPYLFTVEPLPSAPSGLRLERGDLQ